MSDFGDLLDYIRRKKESSLIEQEIAAVEDQVIAEVAKQAEEKVDVKGWGRFYRRGKGWHGPGGFYGPSTPMAKICEEALKEQSKTE